MKENTKDSGKAACDGCMCSAHIDFHPYCNHDKRFLESKPKECKNFKAGEIIYAPYIITTNVSPE
jgi:hypothetical protein